MLHVYQQSNISAVLSERIQSCIVPFSSSGIRTNDPVLPGTKRSGRTGGEDCGKRDGRGIISGMTSVLNHSRLALSARVSERQFSKCHLSLPPTHTDQRGLAHTQTHKKTTGPDLRNLPAIPQQSQMANKHPQAGVGGSGLGKPGSAWAEVATEAIPRERASFTLPGPLLSEPAVRRRHNPKYSINTTPISSKSVRVRFRGASEGYE
ncbi:hypothetical protein ROHU_017517 [Labeo rohita]|uniref:Uncharacterized protein n=1 Tax=Labeo rohita TaxID=84645 RepID=A0A498NGI3_LABRO|nr:hypothetical protein ROHU_017517 [Labeo rohita]